MKKAPPDPRKNFHENDLLFVRCEFGQELKAVRRVCTSIYRSRPSDGDRFGKM